MIEHLENLKNHSEELQKQIQSLNAQFKTCQEEIQKQFPSALETLMNKKRNTTKLFKQDMKILTEAIKSTNLQHKNTDIPQTGNKDNIITEISIVKEKSPPNQVTKLSQLPKNKVAIKKRNTYPENIKQLVFEMAELHGVEDVADHSGISADTIRSFKKTFKKRGSFDNSKGKKVSYPFIKEKLLSL